MEMSETEDDYTFDFVLGLVGLLLFVIIGYLMVAWSKFEGGFYKAHPNIPNGTITYVGLFIIIPIIVYAAMLFTTGLTAVITYIYYATKPRETVLPE